MLLLLLHTSQVFTSPLVCSPIHPSLYLLVYLLLCFRGAPGKTSRISPTAGRDTREAPRARVTDGRGRRRHNESECIFLLGVVKVSKNTVDGCTNINTTACWLIPTGFMVPSISFLLALHQVTQNTCVIILKRNISEIHRIASFQCPSRVCAHMHTLLALCVCACNLISMHVVCVCT